MGENDLGLGLQAIADVAGGADRGPFRILVLDRRQVGERVARPRVAKNCTLGIFARITFSVNWLCSQTSSPPVCASPSMTSELGKTGNCGKWSCR